MSYPVSNAFWSASSSWYTSRVEAQVKASLENGRVAPLPNKERLWKTNGAKYLRHRGDLAQWFKIANKNAYMVRPDPQLSRDVIDYIDKLGPTISALFDAQLGRLAFSAWKAWPVASGLSKSLINLSYELEGDTRFVGRIRVTAPYVFVIKGQPHRELLDVPAKSLSVTLGADVQAAMGSL